MWSQKKSGGHELEVGERLGPYQVEGMLGEGGMGIVFRAVQEPGGDVVALKVLRRELSADTTYQKRFIHEARAAREVTHRHLVPIIDAGEIEGRSFLVSAYIPGRSLDDRLKESGPLSLKDTLRLASHVAGALDALHGASLIHRDVKPGNILFDNDGNAMLSDFGLAKGSAYTVLTKPGQVVGTLDYLAPELIKGSAASPSSDLYALGCVVFECLAGTPPFGHKGVFEVGVAHLEEEPPDPTAARDDVPDGLAWAVLQALAKEPGERPSTATAYANVLNVAARSTSSPG